jgi:hypothetical protein
MNKFNFGLVTVSALALIGCIFDGGEESSSNTSSNSEHIKYTAEPTLITYNASLDISIDKKNDLFVGTKEEEYNERCDSTGNLKTTQETDIDTSYYQIKNGELLTWDNNDCFASIFKGSSQELKGTWSASIGDIQQKIPDDNFVFDEDCKTDKPDTLKFTMTVNFSESKLTYNATRETCWAEEEVEDEMRDIESEYSDFLAVKAIGCNQIEYTLKNGKKFIETKVLSSKTEGRISKTTYNNKECTLNLPPFTALTDKICSEAYQAWTQDEESSGEFSYYQYLPENGRDKARKEYRQCLVDIELEDKNSSASTNLNPLTKGQFSRNKIWQF